MSTLELLANGYPKKNRSMSVVGTIELATVPYTKLPDKTTIKTAYEFGRKLGQGGFGTVKLVVEKSTGTTYAMKSIKKTIGSASRLEQLQREVEIMKKVKHKYIIKVKEVFETPKKVYIIMENCGGGELITKVRQMGSLIKEADIRIVMERIAQAVAYLHGIGIMHRDLKPENVLLMDTPNDLFDIRVGDFGLASYVGSNTVGTTDMMDNTVGTEFYIAPEVFSNVGYSKNCDIWSLGIIMYLMFYRFNYSDASAIVHKIHSSGHVPFPDDVFLDVSPHAKQLIECMLQMDPAKRMSAKEILDHPWISGNFESGTGGVTVLDMMKSYNAEKRLRKIMLTILGAVIFFKPLKKQFSAGTFTESTDSSSAHPQLSKVEEDLDAMAISKKVATPRGSRKSLDPISNKTYLTTKGLSSSKNNSDSLSNSRSTPSTPLVGRMTPVLKSSKK